MSNRDIAEQISEHANAIIALSGQITDPPPDTRRTFAIRALYDINRGSYPGIFNDVMHLNCEQAYQNPTGKDTQLVSSSTGMDQIQEGNLAWTWMGGYDFANQRMKIANDKLGRVMSARGNLGYTVPEHPRNSHRYVLTDDDQITQLSPHNKDTHLNAIADFYDLLHSYDAEAFCYLVDWKEERIGWYGSFPRKVCDGVLLDGYSNYSAANGGYLEDRIPDQARWCEQASLPYSFVVSVHDWQGGSPAYPTPEQYNHAVDQVCETESIDLFHYVWDDEEGKNICDDPDLQAEVGVRMLELTPR